MIKKFSFLIIVLFMTHLLFAQTCGPSGGKGGSDFDDGVTGNMIYEIKVKSGKYIDSIQISYKDIYFSTPPTSRNRHGGNGGGESVFRLEKGEYIVSISGRYGNYIDQLWITTNKGRTQKWGGTGGSVYFTYNAPEGYMIGSFWGRAGKYLDAIGINYVPVPSIYQ